MPLFEVPSPPKFRRPPEDEHPTPSMEDLKHRKPPLPERSISRIFYKSGPLGPQYRKMQKEKAKALWITREMSLTYDDKELQIKINLTEMVHYLIFVGMITQLSYGMFSTNNYILTRALTRQFIERKFLNAAGDYMTYLQIRNPSDLFYWISKSLVPGLYMNFWYVDDKHNIMVDQKDINVVRENKMIGLARFQMIRVKRHSCRIHQMMKGRISTCYAHLMIDTEDKGDFIGRNEQVWKWKRKEGVEYEGKFRDYPMHGYFVDLPGSKSQADSTIYTMKENTWITRSTRLVAIYITVYNANYNLFSFMSFGFETPPTGGTYPRHEFRTMKLLRYVTQYDFFLLGIEMTFCTYTIYFILEEIREIFFFGKPYVSYPWNILDLFIIAMSLFCLCVSLFRCSRVARDVELLVRRSYGFVNFMNLQYWQFVSDTQMALLVFICWFKIFKYLSFTQTMDQFNKTMKRSLKHMFHFSVVFSTFFFGFMFMGNLLFGHHQEEFSDMINSFFSLFRILIGDFDFQGIRTADYVLGPIFFASYLIVCLYIFSNLALAILCESYNMVRGWESFHPHELTTKRFLNRLYYNVFKGCKMKVHVIRYKDRAKITFPDIQAMLKQSNFTDEEIDMFMSKYGINTYAYYFDPEELDRIMTDLEYREFEAFIPPDMLILAAEIEQLAIDRRGRRLGQKAFHGLSIADYEELQERLDLIEIQLEVDAERLEATLKILAQAERDNWARKREEKVELKKGRGG